MNRILFRNSLESRHWRERAGSHPFDCIFFAINNEAIRIDLSKKASL
jgi:hypothetical protein